MTQERYVGILVGLITAIVTLILLALLEQREAASKVAYDCTDPTERERVREIALKGIDDGLQNAMEHLFDIWVKDPNREQPARAQVGTTNAINAHIRARQLALSWTPPTCPPEK
jgi:hypothetical protein